MFASPPFKVIGQTIAKEAINMPFPSLDNQEEYRRIK
jgi:hypothetical protein